MMKIRISFLSLIVLLICNNTFAGSLDTFNVKSYGAIGNGVANDYNALQSAVKALNNNGSGVLYYPPGNYYIANYITTNNKLSDIVIKNCNNVVVSGYNAKITLNGNYIRNVDYTKRNKNYSNTRSINPVNIYDCNNVVIEGLEIDGQVNLTTSNSKVIEAPVRLINIAGSKDVQIKDVYVHHALVDGVYIGYSQNNISENVTGTNIIASNNGRQGMSITGLNGGTFTNCTFKNTAITEGSFGGYAPRAGVDIEPITGNYTKNIVFNNCTFNNNLGGQFICSSPFNTTNVTLNNCSIDAGSSGTPYQIILAVTNAIIENSQIDCGVGSIYPIWNSKPNSSAIIRNNQIKSRASGIAAIPNKELNEQALIENNTITYTGNTIVKKFFPYITADGVTFKNNTVIIPSQYQKPKANIMLRNAKNSNNVFKNENGQPIPKMAQ